MRTEDKLFISAVSVKCIKPSSNHEACNDWKAAAMQLKLSLDFEIEFAEFEESSQSQGKIDSMSGNNFTPSED